MCTNNTRFIHEENYRHVIIFTTLAKLHIVSANDESFPRSLSLFSFLSLSLSLSLSRYYLKPNASLTSALHR